MNRLSKNLILFIIFAILLVVSPIMAQDENGETAESTEEAAPFTPPTRPEPFAFLETDGIRLEMLFGQLKQGRVGVVYVGGENVSAARLQFRDQLAEFYPVADDGFYGLLAVNVDLAPRLYDFSVRVWLKDGSEIVIPAQFEVLLGGFIRQDFDLNPDRAYLADPQVERTEFARLFSVVDDVTTEHFWSDGGFQLPINAELTSPFGAFRIISQTIETRHTGWDLRSPLGTPVMAMAAGRVAFAGPLDIRGNHVIIDHGYGVYSGFSHMSQVHVTRGQMVTRGQVIGMTGNTGRSNGAHAHWEMTVNGEWVDPVDFILTWIP